MTINILMPQLGESVDEAVLSKWLKQEGDPVVEFEPLMEVNTDKVDTEIPAPASGILLRRLVPEGATVKAGTPLAILGQPGESVAEPPAAAPAAADRRELGFISPVVARIASEHGVDLRQVPGTGAGGRITKKDVLAYVEKGGGEREKGRSQEPGSDARLVAEAAPVPAPAPRAAEQSVSQPAPDIAQSAIQNLQSEIPVVGMRRLIAEHMVLSERTAPHVTTIFEADLSAVLAHRAAHKAQFARDGVDLTLTAYFILAAVAALKAVPIVNSQWTDENILLKREVNIGMAVALDEGLIVPVIKHADGKSLLGVAREVNDLAARARAKALRPDEVAGGTFTITNHGVSGSLFAAPIINQPQSGILGVGMMQKRVVVIGDAIAIRPMAYLSLTFDHRVLDGAVADRFLAVVKRTLEGWSA